MFTNCYSTHPKYYGKSYWSWTTGTFENEAAAITVDCEQLSGGVLPDFQDGRVYEVSVLLH